MERIASGGISHALADAPARLLFLEVHNVPAVPYAHHQPLQGCASATCQHVSVLHPGPCSCCAVGTWRGFLLAAQGLLPFTSKLSESQTVAMLERTKQVSLR